MYEMRQDDEALAPDPRWQLALRIAHSEGFRKAARLRSFLLFAVEKTVRNQASDLTEYTIGTEIFERPIHFNPADDSLVRTSARQLRTKLHEYFETEGRQEPLTLEIPKGSYLPEFRERPPSPGTTPAAAPPFAPPTSANRPLLAALAMLCLLLATAAILGWTRQPSPAPAEAAERNLLTGVFPQRGAELTLVLVDSALVVVNAFRPQPLSLEEYIQKADQTPLPLPSTVPGGLAPPTFPGGRLITSFRDAIFCAQLAELAAARGWKLHVRHSRLMQSRDFGKGNFVLLGSPWSNPWVRMFDQNANFQFARDPATGQLAILNRAPQPGEQNIYLASPVQARNGRSFARVGVMPNPAGAGRVMLISGLYAESSEGATEAVLAPAFLAQVEALAKEGLAAQSSAIELLVEVKSLDGAVHERRPIAARFTR